MPQHPLIGQPAPIFTLPNFDGTPYTLTPVGRPIALFFYPKSNSHGCTKEACSFRDAKKDVEVFKKTNCEIVGVSSDDVGEQKRFVDEQGLPYPVLSDKDGVAHKAYQVPRGMLGMTEGRTTYMIDPQGIIQDVYDSVMNYGHHVKSVEKWLAGLPAAEVPST